MNIPVFSFIIIFLIVLFLFIKFKPKSGLFTTHFFPKLTYVFYVWLLFFGGHSILYANELTSDWSFYSNPDKTLYQYGSIASEYKDTEGLFINLDDSNGNQDSYGRLWKKISAEPLLNKRIRVSGYVKFSNLKNGVAWLQVYLQDKNYNMVMSGYDYSPDYVNDWEWQYCEIVLDVPYNSTFISYGLSQTGTGESVLNLFKIEEVSKFIPVKNLNSDYIIQKDMPPDPVSVRVDYINNHTTNIISGDSNPITLSTSGNNKELKEWWVIRNDDNGFSYLDSGVQGWISVGQAIDKLLPTYQGSISKFTDVPLLSTELLPEGQYNYYFGFDSNRNNKIDFDTLTYDWLNINVQNPLHLSGGNGGAGGEYNITIDNTQVTICAPNNVTGYYPMQVAYFFHGDSTFNIYVGNFRKLLTWSKKQNSIILVGLLAPNERGSWWRAFSKDQDSILNTIRKTRAYLEEHYNVYVYKSLYGGVSGGSTLLSYIGSDLVGSAALACGSCGGYRIRPTMPGWKNHLNMYVVYGNKDFLYEDGCIPSSIERYNSYGINLTVKELDGVEHCDFDTSQEIIGYWEKYLVSHVTR